MLKLLEYSHIKNIHVDDPRRTELLKSIIQNKVFLKKIYQTWYKFIVKELPQNSEFILEVGTGGGFLQTHIPSLIRSDIMFLKGMDLICHGLNLPIKDSGLNAVVMINTFHHIASVQTFLSEADRCLSNGGRIIMIEPWISFFSKAIYTRLHHEPCIASASKWGFDSEGPLTGANLALPWIVFQRDKKKFTKLFPRLIIRKISPEVNIRYLISGGVYCRSLLPGWTYQVVEKIEDNLPESIRRQLALFAGIVIEKKETPLNE